MNGTIELKVVERPKHLSLSKGKNKVYYTKIVRTLDAMGETKSIALTPSELHGKDTKTKILSLRTAINRALVALKKDYKVAIEYDIAEDIIHIWRRYIYK